MVQIAKKELLFSSLLAVAIALLFYWRFLDNFFAFDDFKYLENFSHGPLAVLFGYNSLRLISNLSWWPLFSISGLDPLSYNIFSLLLHAANGVLLYLFLTRLTKDRAYGIVGSLFFLVNAVGSDAIFWKATNSSLLNVFFYLLTLISYLLYRERNAKGLHVLSISLFLLAMFSKEEAASMPFILLLLELFFFNGLADKKGVIRRTAPFAAIILLYILANWLVFEYLLHGQAEPAKFFKFRPLHTLLTGWSVFFLSPQGVLKAADPAIYLTALGIMLSFFWVRDKRLLYFGYGWVFFAFLPMSFTTLGQLEPRVICNSISRYLYITSIGSAIVLTAVVIRCRETFSGRVYYSTAALFLAFFSALNYGRVQARGAEWQMAGKPTARFLDSIKKSMPNFPPNSYVFVVNAPTGRAFVQQALRATYQNPEITWIVDPYKYIRKPGENAFLIICNWRDAAEVDLEIHPVK
jgi:hypothetical protein